MKYEKTYFILPTTVFKPNRLIRLGQLIADPRRPYEPLTQPEANPPFEYAFENDWSAEKLQKKNGVLGVFARAFGLVTAKLSGRAKDEFEMKWQAACLETCYFSPDQAYLDKVMSNDGVETWLKKHARLGKTLYMVTGLKIANKPGETTYGESSGSGADVEAGGDPGTGGAVQLGLLGSFGTSSDTKTKGTPTFSYVFAYRLRKVRVTWSSGHASTRLGQEVGGADLSGVGGAGEGGGSLVEDEDEADMQVKSIELEQDDFGAAMSAKFLKVEGYEEDGDGKCLVLVAEVPVGTQAWDEESGVE